MQRSSLRSRRSPPSTTSRAARIAASREIRFIVHASEPDRYPLPTEHPDDSRCAVLPFMALTWQYVSVFLVSVEQSVLLIRLDDVCAADPKIWTAPFGRHERVPDVRHCATQTLRADTGIDFPFERLNVIDNCVVSLAGFGGNTNHVFVVAQWAEDDGPMPAITPPVGAVECQFFGADDLPMMNPPYARRLIEAHLRR